MPKQYQLTFGLGGFVVKFAEQFLILHQVKFVTGVKFSAANDASEAIEVVHIVLCPANNV